ncbi:Arm DNA-binding domain-containing protein [Flavobacterium flavigenum]|uniref:Arm DNA-binding domain-containing protein n=1 Tax=Flavobacterium flavigenum TaxID=3003258 RepID=UPI0022AC1542|nr:Arm DNA-binding domain-containing protein [Flavobacterium flavigenum]
MKTKLLILFHAKSAKASASSLVPIYARIPINGKRIELSSNRFVEISKWCKETGRMKGRSAEASLINSHLDITRTQIIDAQLELNHKSIPVTSETLKNKLL